MGTFFNTSKTKLFFESNKVKKAYKGCSKIYSSGNIVTYIVDSSTSYTEEVDEGASCLSPISFTLPANGFSRLSYSFSKWAINSTSGTQYSSGAKVAISNNTIFYAQWSLNQVFFFQNSALKTTSNVSYDYQERTTCTISVSGCTIVTFAGYDDYSPLWIKGWVTFGAMFYGVGQKLRVHMINFFCDGYQSYIGNQARQTSLYLRNVNTGARTLIANLLNTQDSYINIPNDGVLYAVDIYTQLRSYTSGSAMTMKSTIPNLYTCL